MYSYTFSFWGSLDQDWIDTKVNQFWIDDYDVKKKLKDFCFTTDQILDSPNPVIVCLIEVILDQFVTKLIDLDVLTDTLINTIREQLSESIYINALDSHLEGEQVFESLKDEIINELTDSENLEQFEEVKMLFYNYDF